MKNAKLSSRIYAFLIDYMVIILYGGILFGATTLLFSKNNFDHSSLSPFQGQLIGLITLTIPVILYFSLMESGEKHATIGKWLLKIKISDEKYNNPGIKAILIRNLVKLFMPWEIAHFGVHWTIYFNSNNTDGPLWLLAVLIFPQLMVIIYLISIIINRENRSLYDKISKTRVINRVNEL